VPTEAKWTYTFRTAYGSGNYDVSKAKLTGSTKFIMPGSNNPYALAFNNDGTKFYTWDDTSPSHVTEWTTPNAWRFEYATITHMLSQTATITESNIKDMKFGDSGTKLYLMGSGQDSAIQYNLTTAYDLSTASYSTYYSFSAQVTVPQGIAFKSDGTKMYILDNSGYIWQYSLSTAWNVSTASYDSVNVNLSTYLLSSNSYGMYFSSDGTKIHILNGASYNFDNTYSLTSANSMKSVHQFDLSTAWDLSTASYVRDANLAYFYQGYQLQPISDYSQYAFAMSNDGKYIGIATPASDLLTMFELADLYTLTLPSSLQNYIPEPYRPDHTVSLTFYTADGGTNVYLVDQQQFPNK